MRFDLEEITQAWIDSVFATEIQRQIATERNTICQSCPSLQTKFKKVKKLSIQACGECGCPISKKIFSRKFNFFNHFIITWYTINKFIRCTYQ